MLTGLYGDDARFRSTIDMARHRFGQGEYRYFDRPLPELVAELRTAFWPHLLRSPGNGPDGSGGQCRGPTPR